MPIRFACPHCRQKLSVAQRKAGEQAECPRCHQSLTIPQPPMDAAAPAAAIPPPPAVANPPPEDHTKSLAILQQLGGGFARTDSSGRFELEVPRRGRYLLLVISRDQQSRRDSEAKAADIQKLRPFFDNPAQLLGDRRYQL